MSLTVGLAILVLIVVLVRVMLRAGTKPDDNVSASWLKQDKKRRRHDQ